MTKPLPPEFHEDLEQITLILRRHPDWSRWLAVMLTKIDTQNSPEPDPGEDPQQCFDYLNDR